MIEHSGVRPLYSGKVYKNSGNLALLNLIPPGAQTIMDVGCGAGDNARILSGAGIKVWGATASASESQIAREFCEEVWTGDLEVDPLPFQLRFFDVLLLSHVLEHFIRPENMLTKLAPYLKEGGVIVAGVPNMANFRCRWRLLKGDWRREDAGPFDRTHYQFFSYETFDDLFELANYKLLAKDPGQTAIPLWPLRRMLPRRFCATIDHFVGRRFPNLFSDQVLVVARPAVSR